MSAWKKGSVSGILFFSIENQRIAEHEMESNDDNITSTPIVIKGIVPFLMVPSQVWTGAGTDV